MNALQYKDGKFELVPNLIKKAKNNTWGDVGKATDQALSNSIEVAPECVELAEELLREHLYFVADELIPMDGKVYPIEGLTYEIKMESVETSELKTGTYEVVGWAGKKYTVKYDHEQDKGWFQMPYSKLKASSTTFKLLKQVAIINK